VHPQRGPAAWAVQQFEGAGFSHGVTPFPADCCFTPGECFSDLGALPIYLNDTHAELLLQNKIIAEFLAFLSGGVKPVSEDLANGSRGRFIYRWCG
jgi:hypothetical protein